MSSRIHCLHRQMLVIVMVMFTVSVVAPINGSRTEEEEIWGPLVLGGVQGSGNVCPPPPIVYTPNPPVAVIHTASTPSPPQRKKKKPHTKRKKPHTKKKKPRSPPVMSPAAPPPYTTSGENQNVVGLAVLFGCAFLGLSVSFRF